MLPNGLPIFLIDHILMGGWYSHPPISNSGPVWALVSEPGFLDFQIFDYRYFFVCNIILENLVVRYRGKNNKGVLERPWTKWRVLRATSSTLKFQVTENHENSRFDYSVRQKIGDPGPIKLRTIFPHTSVLSKPPQLPNRTNESICGQVFWFFQFFPIPNQWGIDQGPMGPKKKHA